MPCSSHFNLEAVCQQGAPLEFKKVRDAVLQYHQFTVQHCPLRYAAVEILQLRESGEQLHVPFIPQAGAGLVKIADAPAAVQLQLIDPSIVIEWFLHLGNQHGAYSLFLEQVHYAVPVFFRPFPLDISRLFCSASIRSITLPGSLVSAVTISCP